MVGLEAAEFRLPPVERRRPPCKLLKAAASSSKSASWIEALERAESMVSPRSNEDLAEFPRISGAIYPWIGVPRVMEDFRDLLAPLFMAIDLLAGRDIGIDSSDELVISASCARKGIRDTVSDSSEPIPSGSFCLFTGAVRLISRPQSKAA